jgi:lipopolysaccharide export system permease protein
LDRYLATELFRSVVFGILLFSLIWLAPETLYQLFQDAFSGRLGIGDASLLLLYQLPPVLLQTIPMAVLVASVFLTRRLSHQFEWHVLLSSGISKARIWAPMLAVGLFFTLLYGVVQDVILPVTGPRVVEMNARFGLKEVKNRHFIFLERDPQRPERLNKFFLVGDVSKQRLRDILVLYFASNEAETGRPGVQIQRILKASHGLWDARTQAWRLRDGEDYELDAQGVYRQTRHFDEQWVTTSLNPGRLLSFNLKNTATLSTPDLAQYVGLLQEVRQLEDARYFRIRLYQKIALPLAATVFVWLGAMLGLEPPRSRRALSLTSAAVVLFFYVVMVPLATNLGSLGLLPAWLAAALPLMVAIGGTLGVLFIRRSAEG